MQKTLSHSEIGATFTTAAKLITQTEEELFCVITENKLAMFLSDEAAQKKGWEKRIVPGVMTFSIAIGLMESSGILDDVVAFLGTDNLRFVKPAYIGDSLRVMVELKDKKLSKGGSRGTVHYEWRLVNQNDEDVVRGLNTCMFKAGFFAAGAAS
jgi:acyl dehydratase